MCAVKRHACAVRVKLLLNSCSVQHVSTSAICETLSSNPGVTTCSQPMLVGAGKLNFPTVVRGLVGSQKRPKTQCR